MSSLTISRLRTASSREGGPIKLIAIAAAAAVMVFAGSVTAAEAHGGRHGSPHMAIDGGSHFAGGQRRGNDAYTKAASEDRDKLLNSKLKDICRGC